MSSLHQLTTVLTDEDPLTVTTLVVETVFRPTYIITTGSWPVIGLWVLLGSEYVRMQPMAIEDPSSCGIIGSIVGRINEPSNIHSKYIQIHSIAFKYIQNTFN